MNTFVRCSTCGHEIPVQYSRAGDLVLCRHCNSHTVVSDDVSDALAVERHVDQDHPVTGTSVSIRPNLPPTSPGIATTTPLFTSGSVAVASFFGCPLAGGIILAKNYRRMGQPAHATQALTLSCVATLVLFATFSAIPDDANLPTGPFLWLQVWGMYAIAKAKQGRSVEGHRFAGGAIASRWRAAGIGLLVSIGMVALVFLFALFIGSTEDSR